MNWWQTAITVISTSGVAAKAWEWYKRRQWNAALARLGHNVDDFQRELDRLRLEKKIPPKS